LQAPSLGLIETIGYVAAIEAADAGCKAANVSMLGFERGRAGLITVKFAGDVAAVSAAVTAGAAAAGEVGKVLAVHVIAHPDRQLDVIAGGGKTRPEVRAEAQAKAGIETGPPTEVGKPAEVIAEEPVEEEPVAEEPAAKEAAEQAPVVEKAIEEEPRTEEAAEISGAEPATEPSPEPPAAAESGTKEVIGPAKSSMPEPVREPSPEGAGAMKTRRKEKAQKVKGKKKS
jgi:microcompartment protein CcmL/EutN